MRGGEIPETLAASEKRGVILTRTFRVIASKGNEARSVVSWPNRF